MRTANGTERLPASFRDPAGFLFFHDDVLYRQINRAYEDKYARLMNSGLYQQLVTEGLLVPHEESTRAPAVTETAFIVIQPERVPFVSYPFEWSFSQLKDAALTTLSIQKRALQYDMILKDASAYNIQFVEGRPVLIDTLSFEFHEDGRPWDAYRQFCQHFIAPLALMSYRDVRLGQLLRIHLDGIPLDLAGKLLPFRTLLHFGLLTHIHLHAAAQKRFANRAVGHPARVSSIAMTGLIESLEGLVRRLTWKPSETEWEHYYDNTNYSDQAFEVKRKLVRAWSEQVKPGRVIDFGANTGLLSREAAAGGAYVISMDLDPAVVEQNYKTVRRAGEKNILPLLLDLTNPSPQMGWNSCERDSFIARSKGDLALALALLHHLAISNNLPLVWLADFFAAQSRWLIIEFIPKSDSQAQRLLASRRDIFPEYSREGFEMAFSAAFEIVKSEPLGDSERILYLLKTR